MFCYFIDVAPPCLTPFHSPSIKNCYSYNNCCPLLKFYLLIALPCIISLHFGRVSLLIDFIVLLCLNSLNICISLRYVINFFTYSNSLPIIMPFQFGFLFNGFAYSLALADNFAFALQCLANCFANSVALPNFSLFAMHYILFIT